LDNSSGTLSLFINGSPAHAFPAGSGGLRPQIANNGAVVVQDGSTITSPITVFQLNKTPVVIADSTDFDALGSSPGISPDGQVVVFYGDLTYSGAVAINSGQPGQIPLQPGDGIFASVNTISNARFLVRIAGEKSTTFLNPGETFQNTNADGIFAPPDTKLIGVSGFDPNAPVAVNAIQNTGTRGAVTIVYMAKQDDGTDGLYANRLDFLPDANGTFSPQDPGSFRDNVDTLVCGVGDTIIGLGTVQTLSIYDPVNSVNEIAFCVTTNTGVQGVVRDNTFVPILWVPPESQGNQALPALPTSEATGGGWASDPYAGGGDIPVGQTPPLPHEGDPYTIQNNGCTLTVLSMALSYAGIQTNPRSLNTLLSTPPYLGFNGHSMILSTDIAIATECQAHYGVREQPSFC
jgi:hypothetical protein